MTSRVAGSNTSELTLVGLLAAACIGLASGAALLGVLLSAGDPLLGLLNFLRSLAVGACFLLPIGPVVGAPAMASLRRRKASLATSMLIIAIGGSVVTLLLAVVLGLITGSVWTAFQAVIPAAVYCLGCALLLGRFFSKRRALSVTVIGIVLVASVVTGVVSFLTPAL